jgi:hypothetical protein
MNWLPTQNLLSVWKLNLVKFWPKGRAGAVSFAPGAACHGAQEPIKCASCKGLQHQQFGLGPAGWVYWPCPGSLSLMHLWSPRWLCLWVLANHGLSHQTAAECESHHSQAIPGLLDKGRSKAPGGLGSNGHNSVSKAPVYFKSKSGSQLRLGGGQNRPCLLLGGASDSHYRPSWIRRELWPLSKSTPSAAHFP